MTWIAKVMHAVRGFFQAADEDRLTIKGYARADNRDIDSRIIPDLETLRNRCRFEIANSGYASGIANTFADDVVGASGPTLRLTADVSDRTLQSVRDAWEQWSEVCDIRGRQHLVDVLRTGVRNLGSDGEFLLRMVNGGGDTSRVSLRLMEIEPDRLFTPLGLLGDKSIRGGIKFDALGRATLYYVHFHPGDQLGGYQPTAVEPVPARFMLHFFAVQEAGQSRGVPWLAPVLNNFHHFRQFTEATVLAARVAAHMGAAMVHTNNPLMANRTASAELDVMDIEPGVAMQLPEGWNVTQMKAEHPNAEFLDFRKAMLGEFGRPYAMPWIRVACDAGDSNFSAARLDMNAYFAAVRALQAQLERRVLRPLWREFESELRMTRPLPSAEIHPRWVWDPAPSVDPLSDAQAQKQRLENNTTTLEIECAANGHAVTEIIDQRKKEAAMLLEAGLAPKGQPANV